MPGKQANLAHLDKIDNTSQDLLSLTKLDWCYSVTELYRRQYYEVLDIAICSINDLFEQPGYKMYTNLKSLLVEAANRHDFDEYLEVTAFYKDDFDRSLLSTQLQSLPMLFVEPVSFQACLKTIWSLSDGQKSFFSQVCRLVCLILVMTATNAVSERMFSVMRRIKTYLRSSMCEDRFNHLMILTVHKDETGKLDIDNIGDEFVHGSGHRLSVFDKFVRN